MIAPDRVVAILLAAGRATRFGGDKMGADLAGRPLAHHAADTLASIGFARLIAVGRTPFDHPRFEPIMNPAPERGQSSSIALGVAAAMRAAPDAILIALGDMPSITASHLRALLDAYTDGGIVASASGGPPSPPALFAATHASALCALTGDRGARGLLETAVLVQTQGAILADVDTPADLARIRKGQS